MLGISGPHRSGKTTLMKLLASCLELTPVHTNVGDVFKDLGLEASKQYPFDVRMEVQAEILRRFKALLQEARAAYGDRFITDRTPLDLIAYTLADIGPETVKSRVIAQRVNDYVAECYALVTEFYGFVICLQPGIAVVPGAFKGSLCPAYVEHFNTLMLGCALDARCKTARLVVPRTLTDLDGRVHHVVNAMQSASVRFVDKRKSTVH